MRLLVSLIPSPIRRRLPAFLIGDAAPRRQRAATPTGPYARHTGTTRQPPTSTDAPAADRPAHGPKPNIARRSTTARDGNGATTQSAPGTEPRAKNSQPATTARRSPIRTRAANPAATPHELSTTQLASHMGVSVVTINLWRRKGQIYGYKANKKSFAYPSVQIMKATSSKPIRVVPGLGEVLARFADEDKAWTWLTSENPAMGTAKKAQATPLDALRRGRRVQVLKAANQALAQDS